MYLDVIYFFDKLSWFYKNKLIDKSATKVLPGYSSKEVYSALQTYITEKREGVTSGGQQLAVQINDEIAPATKNENYCRDWEEMDKDF